MADVSEVKHLILADHSQAFEGKLLVLACASITFASAAEWRTARTSGRDAPCTDGCVAAKADTAALCLLRQASLILQSMP